MVITKKPILLFVLLLIVSSFSLSDDGNQEPNKITLKDKFDIDTGMSQIELDEFKSDYFEFAKENKLQFVNLLYYNKVNLNKIDEFNNLHISLDSGLDMCSIEEFLIHSELVVLGTYENFIIDDDLRSSFPISYKVKIDEIISNETEYTDIPEYIVVKGLNLANAPLEVMQEKNKEFIAKKNQYLMFLTRYDFYSFKEAFSAKKTNKYVKDDCFKPYTFSIVRYSLRSIENNEIISFNSENYSNPKSKKIDLHQFKDFVNSVRKINDSENFYRRKYK